MANFHERRRSITGEEHIHSRWAQNELISATNFSARSGCSFELALRTGHHEKWLDTLMIDRPRAMLQRS